MRIWLATPALALAFGACSGISTTSDWDPSYDFSAVSTYAWKPQAVEAGMSEIILRRMYVAVDDDLSAKGLTKTDESRADVLIAYHIGAQDRQQLETYGYGAGGWWDGYRGGGMTTTTVRTYTEGSLILDVIDREENELVWRGSASKTIDQMDSPEQRVQTIQEAVGKMLKDFPPR